MRPDIYDDQSDLAGRLVRTITVDHGALELPGSMIKSDWSYDEKRGELSVVIIVDQAVTVEYDS